MGAIVILDYPVALGYRQVKRPLAFVKIIVRFKFFSYLNELACCVASNVKAYIPRKSRDTQSMVTLLKPEGPSE